MKTHFATLLILLALAPTQTFSQTGNSEARLDSLYQALVDGKSTTDDIEFYYKHVFAFASYNPAKSITAANMLLDLAEEKGDKRLLADMHHHLGNIYRGLGLEENAIEHHLLSAELFGETRATGSLAFSYIDIGNIFFDVANYDDAASYYERVLELEDSAYDLREAKAVALNNLGLIAEELNDKPTARARYQSALELRKDLATEHLVVHSFQHFGGMYFYFEEYDSALYYFHSSRKMIAEMDAPKHLEQERLWNTWDYLGDTYYKIGEYRKSLAYSDSALSLALEMNFTNYRILTLLQAAKSHYELRNISTYRQTVNQAYNLAVEFEMWSLQKEILEHMVEVEVQLGDFQNAYEHQSELYGLQQFLTDKASKIEISSRTYEAELSRLKEEAERNAELRDAQESALQSQKNTNTILYIFVFSFLIFLFILASLLAQVIRKRKASARDNELILSQSKEIERTNARLKKTNDLLEESLQQKSTFMSKMSHEIRTPMNAIGGLTEILLQQSLNADQEQLVRNINHSSLRLTSLVDDILDYSRLESGRVELHPTNFNLLELIDDVVNLNITKAENNHTLIHERISPDIPEELYGDANKLQQILSNLLSNAVKFTENGHVYIRVFLDESTKKVYRIGFEIEDSGIGIAADHIDTIFDEFQQASSDIHARFGGTGLGLAICKQLIELMKGTISVRSQPGKGSTFYFSLPFEPAKEKTKQDTSAQMDISGKTLLLVEDDRMNQFVAQRLLNPTGVIVEVANDGQEAIDLCKENEYDIILMDVQMPVVDGIEATLSVRKEGKNTSTPIIALTADVQAETKKAALEAGMNDLVTKPFQGNDLIEKISKLLGSSVVS